VGVDHPVDEGAHRGGVWIPPAAAASFSDRTAFSSASPFQSATTTVAPASARIDANA
jgi:hypothetical protein